MSASHSAAKAAAASGVGVGSSACAGEVGVAVGTGVAVGSAWPHAANTSTIAAAVSASMVALLPCILILLMAVSPSPQLPRARAAACSQHPGIFSGWLRGWTGGTRTLPPAWRCTAGRTRRRSVARPSLEARVIVVPVGCPSPARIEGAIPISDGGPAVNRTHPTTAALRAIPARAQTSALVIEMCSIPASMNTSPSAT